MAWRYLFSKKSRNAIHLITGLSMLAIGVVSAALVILLSAFNGLEWKVIGMFDLLDPPLLVQPAEGKRQELSAEQEAALNQHPDLAGFSRVLEESVLFTYGTQQKVGQIKGIEPIFLEQVALDTLLISGSLPKPQSKGPAQTLLGQGLATSLGIRIGEPFKQLVAYCPKSGGIDLFQPFRDLSLKPSGIFFVPQESNETLALLGLEEAQKLTGSGKKISAIYLYPKSGADLIPVQEQVMQLLGEGWTVKNRLEQHALIYKILRTEKLAVFLIVAFIMLIASFNLMSVQTLLVVEKRKDLMVLWSLGAHAGMLRSIFTLLGTLVSFLGCIAGMLLGLAVVGLQALTGWYPLNAAGEPYPVVVYFSDLALVFATVFSVGLLISWWRMQLVKFKKEDAIQVLK
jgi:lipoprotein-releasing system permease protein